MALSETYLISTLPVEASYPTSLSLTQFPHLLVYKEFFGREAILLFKNFVLDSPGFVVSNVSKWKFLIFGPNYVNTARDVS